MFQLFSLLTRELAMYVWTKDYDGFIRRFSNKAVKLNIVYAKVVQAFVVKFAPDAMDIAHNILPENTYNPPSIDGVTYDPCILGSGMVSVVYSGTFKEKGVVVKVKRVGVEQEIRAGLRLLERLFWWLDFVPYVHKFDLGMLLREVRSMLTEQLDFDTEVANQEEFRKMFEFNPLIVVPIVHMHTADYIVMERLIPVECDEALKEHYAKQIVQLAIKSAVFDGFIHADVHVGNVVFLPEKRLGIIDFGLMLRLTKRQQDDYLSLFNAVNDVDYVKTATMTLDSYMYPRRQVYDREGALQTMAALYKIFYEEKKLFGVPEISELMLKVYPFGYSVKPHFYKIVMSMAASEMFLRYLSPHSKNILKEEIKALSKAF